MSPTCITLQQEDIVKELQTAKADNKVSEKFIAELTQRCADSTQWCFELTSELKDARAQTAQLQAQVKRASSMFCTCLPLVLVIHHA